MSTTVSIVLTVAVAFVVAVVLAVIARRNKRQTRAAQDFQGESVRPDSLRSRAPGTPRPDVYPTNAERLRRDRDRDGEEYVGVAVVGVESVDSEYDAGYTGVDSDADGVPDLADVTPLDPGTQAAEWPSTAPWDAPAEPAPSWTPEPVPAPTPDPTPPAPTPVPDPTPPPPPPAPEPAPAPAPDPSPAPAPDPGPSPSF